MTHTSNLFPNYENKLDKCYDNFLDRFRKKYKIDDTSSYDELNDLKIKETFYQEYKHLTKILPYGEIL